MLFLDPHTGELHRDWPDEAALTVASLRFIAAQNADDCELAALIGELTLRSRTFATLWAAHPVQRDTSGIRRFRHPDVGDLDLAFEVLHLADASGHRVLTHTAAPGSPAEAALRLLDVAERFGSRTPVSG